MPVRIWCDTQIIRGSDKNYILVAKDIDSQRGEQLDAISIEIEPSSIMGLRIT